MGKFKIILFYALSALLLLSAGCSGKAEDTDKAPMVTGVIKYEVVDTANMEKLPEKLAGWYEENYKDKGLYSFNYDGSTYLLLSAGEKPTDGYGIEQLILTGAEQEIEVTGTLSVPGTSELVAQVLTYPNILVKIPEDPRELKLAELKENTPAANPVQKDYGTYVGQIDNNSIEIKISGVPEAKAAYAFQLADKVKDNFDRFGLQTGDQVHFSYFKNEQSQLILTSIEKIQN